VNHQPLPQTQVRRTLTQADFNAFAALSGDDNPIHVDPDFSARTRFGRTVAHGVLLYSILRGVAEKLIPNARQTRQLTKFAAPTYADEEMVFSATVLTDDGKTAHVACEAVRENDGTKTCEMETWLTRI
jgi:acyl dehydratase